MDVSSDFLPRDWRPLVLNYDRDDGCERFDRRQLEVVAILELAEAIKAARVQAVLLAVQNIYARHIDINVDRGVVHLGGFVWENDDFQTARRDAASAPGVKTVVTEMELLRGGLGGAGR